MSATRAAGSQAPGLIGWATVGSRSPMSSMVIPGRQIAWRTILVRLRLRAGSPLSVVTTVPSASMLEENARRTRSRSATGT